MTTYLRIGDQNIDVEQSLVALDRADCAEDLTRFIALAWHILEPQQKYVHNWHIDAIAEHLEAITDSDGRYNRLLINIPPGCMKSLLVNVLWPAWEWGPRNLAHTRWINAAHSQDLAVRDSNKMRRLITSDWYQARWPHVVLTSDQNQKMKFENTQSGFRQAAAAGSITGNRADRLIIDDPHSVEGANSDQMRKSTIEWFLEAVPTRMNNPDRSTIVVIMQRLHEDDVSGAILERGLGYDHLMLPMRFDTTRSFPTKIGFQDPRTEPGQLLFPERFPPDVVERDEKAMGPYATAGQFQQEPAPRGGGILKREWWRLWPDPMFPPMEFVLASLDTAYTTRSENDFSAMTVWGVFSGSHAAYASHWAAPGGRLLSQEQQTAQFDEATGVRTLSPATGGDTPRVVLMSAWAERLELHDLVTRIAETCRKMKVDRLLIENKASGYSVAQEIRRLFGHEDWSVHLLDPKGTDKLARLYSVQHFFAEGLVFAPEKAWADMVIQQASIFPKGKHDDLVDTVSQALRHLRDIGLLTRQPEWASQVQESVRANTHGAAAVPSIYPS